PVTPQGGRPRSCVPGDAGCRSVEADRETLARLGDARVRRADDLEVVEEAHAQLLLRVRVRTGQEVEQAPERVVDVPAEQVEVGDRELRVDVAWRVGGGGAHGREVGVARALQEADLRE